MAQLIRGLDQRSGSDRRKVDRRRPLLPPASESLSASHVTTAYLLTLVIFAADALLPLGLAVPALYVIPLAYLALWSRPEQATPVLLLAGASSALTLVGYFVSPPGLLWEGRANRALAILVIVFMTVLSILRKQTEEDVQVLRGLLPICSYCKKIRDDHGYWEKVERYVAVRSQADFSHSVCPECEPKHTPSWITTEWKKAVSARITDGPVSDSGVLSSEHDGLITVWNSKNR